MVFSNPCQKLNHPLSTFEFGLDLRFALMKEAVKFCALHMLLSLLSRNLYRHVRRIRGKEMHLLHIDNQFNIFAHLSLGMGIYLGDNGGGAERYL